MALGLVHLTFPINLHGTSVSLAAERYRLFGYNADYVVRIMTTARDTEGVILILGLRNFWEGLSLFYLYLRQQLHNSLFLNSLVTKLLLNQVD